MEVIRQDVDALNADLVVKVANEDYAEKFNATLKDYAKKVNLPGFRNGKVPFPVVKKRFGKSILAEEMNNILNEALQNYITENKLNILGNPMPKEDVDVKGDWENPGEFEFSYSIGLSPELEVKLNKRSKQAYYNIKVDDSILNDEIENLQRRYGSLTNVDKVGANDLVLGQFVELNDDDSIKEAGIMNSSSISVEFLDAAAKKALKGKKVGDTIVVDPRNYSKDDNDLATMLGITPEQIASISDKFNFTISEVKEMKKAEIDEEFLMKATNDDSIKTEADLKDWFKGNIEKSFAESSDELFIRQVSNGLVDKLNPELPEAFLKTWSIRFSTTGMI